VKPRGGLAWHLVVVYAPALGVVTEVLPCDNGHAQERARCGAVVDTGEAGDLWMEDRHVCPRALLCAIDKRGAFCVTRDLRGDLVRCSLPGARLVVRQRGKSLSRAWVWWRRTAQASLSSPTYQVERSAPRRGDASPHLDACAAPGVGPTGGGTLPQRWTLDTACTPREASLPFRNQPLGSPKAA